MVMSRYSHRSMKTVWTTLDHLVVATIIYSGGFGDEAAPHLEYTILNSVKIYKAQKWTVKIWSVEI